MSSTVSAGRARVSAVLALTAVLALIVAGTASADNPTFNNARVNITGGNAVALSACINVAKVKAKYPDKVKQNNFCKNFAKATGGDVTLKNVNVFIAQDTYSVSANSATVNIAGGDAVAVAACLNVLDGSASATQTNVCKNTAVARGGDVKLKNVDITIIQES